MDGHADHTMDHSQHGHMDHAQHGAGHGHGADSAAGVAHAVMNATLEAATTAATELAAAVHKHMSGDMDHSGHNMSAMESDSGGGGAADHSQHVQLNSPASSAHDHSQHMAAAATGAAHGAHGGMMAMTFHFGVTEYVLFDAWHVTTAGGMVASCLGLFLIALLYEGLKYKREDMLRKNATRDQFDTIRVPSEGGVTEVTTVSPSRGYSGGTGEGAGGAQEPERCSDSGDSAESRPITAAGRRQRRQRMFSKHHFLQTFLHAVQVVVGYFLMLAFMTYNVWLGLAIVLGAAAGYFIFGSKKFVVVDVTEHCH